MKTNCELFYEWKKRKLDNMPMRCDRCGIGWNTFDALAKCDKIVEGE